MWPRGHTLQTAADAPLPADVRRPTRDITGEAISRFDKPPAHTPRLWRVFCGEYYVISIESEDMDMSIRGKSILITLAIMLIGTAPAWSQSLLKTLDPDNDGTVDLAEAQAGATKKFAKLNPDNDGTLDAKELSGVLDAAAIKAADPDNDGTLDQKEYAAVVEAKFKAANPDNDGTIDKKELDSSAGQELVKLVH